MSPFLSDFPWPCIPSTHCQPTFRPSDGEKVGRSVGTGQVRAGRHTVPATVMPHIGHCSPTRKTKETARGKKAREQIQGWSKAGRKEGGEAGDRQPLAPACLSLACHRARSRCNPGAEILEQTCGFMLCSSVS